MVTIKYLYIQMPVGQQGQLLTQAKQTLPFWKVMGLLVWPYVATHPSRTGCRLYRQYWKIVKAKYVWQFMPKPQD